MKPSEGKNDYYCADSNNCDMILLATPKGPKDLSNVTLLRINVSLPTPPDNLHYPQIVIQSFPNSTMISALQRIALLGV